MTTTGQERAERLAAIPLRSVGPARGVARGGAEQLVEVWRHRELLGLLVRRELKARYKDSLLGFFWSLARPLTLLAVYYVAIGQFLGARGAIPDFAIFVFAGLTAWQLFSDIVIGGTGSIVANAGLIKKVYVPREIFPLAVVGSALFNFAIQLGILVGATALLGQFPTGARWLYLPLALAALVLFATAIAIFLAAVNVYLRDIQYLVEILLMVFFWASPIVYSWALVSGHLSGWLERLYLLNPMTLVVLAFHQVFWVAGDDQPVPTGLTPALFGLLGVSVVLLWLSQRVFARLQGNFAQEL